MSIGYKKFRYPFVAKDLALGNFFKGVLLFISKHSGDADFYPNYDDVVVKIGIYSDILGRNLLIKQTVKDRRERYDGALVDLYRGLHSLRILLPALFGSNDMLDDFGLLFPFGIGDVNKFWRFGRICRDHWAEISVPVPPPEYVPLAGRLDSVAGLVESFENKRTDYVSVRNRRAEIHNDKNAARKEALEAERRLFRWFQALYPDARDEYWTETPWGRAPRRKKKTGDG